MRSEKRRKEDGCKGIERRGQTEKTDEKRSDERWPFPLLSTVVVAEWATRHFLPAFAIVEAKAPSEAEIIVIVVVLTRTPSEAEIIVIVVIEAATSTVS